MGTPSAIRRRGDDDQFPFGRPSRVPSQVVLRAKGLPILVHAKEGEIETITRIGEVVGIAPEEGDLLLRREDQAHVGVPLVAIEPIFGPMIERHHFRMEAGRFATLPLDPRDLSPPRLESFALAHAGSNARVHSRRHVLHVDEDVESEIRALQFLPSRTGVEAIAHVIPLRRRELLQLRERDVMIGEHESVRAHERSRSAVAESNAGEPNVIEPLAGRREAIPLFELCQRRIVKRPHPLVRPRERPPP